MKLGFIADIHIKLGQKGVPKEWAYNRFQQFLAQVEQHNNSVDFWVIGGDVFDRLPTMDEVELFYDFITVFSKPTFIIPGNHESVKKNTTFLSHLAKSVNRINKNVEIITECETRKDLRIDFLPYNRLKEYAEGKCSHEFTQAILVTHVRGEIPPHVKPEVPLELFDKWSIVLAGDLHSYENSQRNILYPGSPYTTSFHRTPVDTGFIILDTYTLEHEWVKFNLPQLIKKTVKAGEPTPVTDYDHTMYEVEGSLTELAAVGDSSVIDKKVIQRARDTTLILDPRMSLRQEVEEYLTYILELDSKTILKTLEIFDGESNSLHN